MGRTVDQQEKCISYFCNARQRLNALI